MIKDSTTRAEGCVTLASIKDGAVAGDTEGHVSFLFSALGYAENIVAVRASEIHTRQQATELLELHRRKDEFLATLSHELRNPLASLTNAVYVLRLQQGSENLIQQQSLALIERQLGQLRHLVDDLMDVSRIASGRVRLCRERVAVGSIVAAAVEAVRPLLDQRRHAFTVSLPDEPIWLLADAARLQQVLVNLLTNAAKYTDEGGQVLLTVHPEDGACVVRVRDTGMGISATLLPRIFDLFVQAERSIGRAQGGLGIGLSLVRQLVALHDGTVEARSAEGEGSEFVVRLPTQPPPLLLAKHAEPAGVRTRVLVIDDTVDMAETLAILLKSAGYDARTAYDGPTALQAALQYRPDAVLLDIGLPGMSGYEIAKRIRRHPLLRGVTLIALTGYGQEADRQASLRAGFSHHLVKPADFEDVKAVLATIGNGAARHPAGPARSSGARSRRPSHIGATPQVHPSTDSELPAASYT